MSEKKSVWTLEPYKHLQTAYLARVNHVQRWRKYYLGTMYSGSNFTQDTFGIPLVDNAFQTISSQMKAVFHPFPFVAMVDAALVPGGWKLDEESAELEAVKNDLFKLTRFRKQQQTFLTDASRYGLAGLKIIDDRRNGKLMIQAARMDQYLLDYSGSYDRRPTMSISVWYGKNQKGERAEYAEVITPQRIITYRDGQLAPLYGEYATYQNTMGFVPYVEAKLGDEGLGMPSYWSAARQLDIANEMATNKFEMIKKHVNPQWVVSGVEEAEDLQRDDDSVWFLADPGSKADALVAQLDLDSVRNFVADMYGNIKETLPAMSLADVRGLERISWETIKVQMAGIRMHINAMRDDIDCAVEDALRMAGRAGASMGGEMAKFAVLDDERLALDAERPVIAPDEARQLALQAQRQSVEMGGVGLEQQRLLARGEESPSPQPSPEGEGWQERSAWV